MDLFRFYTLRDNKYEYLSPKKCDKHPRHVYVGETELRKADRTVGVVRPCLTKYWKIYKVHPNRTVSLSEFSFFKLAFAFVDQNPPGSDTFDLAVGPF